MGPEVLAEFHNVKVSTLVLGVSMPLFIYRCPKFGYSVQGFSAEDISEDKHVYEAVTCPKCHQIHYVNPATGAVSEETVE